MNVIRHGYIPRYLTFKCIHCGCVFEANKDEYSKFKHNDNYYYEVECPECNESLVVPTRYSHLN